MVDSLYLDYLYTLYFELKVRSLGHLYSVNPFYIPNKYIGTCSAVN